MKYTIWIPIIGIYAGTIADIKGYFVNKDSLAGWNILYQALCCMICFFLCYKAFH